MKGEKPKQGHEDLFDVVMCFMKIENTDSMNGFHWILTIVKNLEKKMLISTSLHRKGYFFQLGLST